MKRASRSPLLIFASVLVFVSFFLLVDENQGNLSIDLNKFNWLQITIILAIVFLVGMAFSKKKIETKRNLKFNHVFRKLKCLGREKDGHQTKDLREFFWILIVIVHYVQNHAANSGRAIYLIK